MSAGFSATPAELSLVNEIFKKYDTAKLGVITGEVAVRAFQGAKVQPSVLGEIWSVADEENNGWLSKKGVAIALRLIGYAQKGDKITVELLSKPGPVPVIEGISSVSTNNTGMSIPRSSTMGSYSLPPLTPDDKTKFLNMFIKAGPQSGLLSGEQARDIFVKSRLGNDKLLQIWNLADTQDRGALDSTDFIIGMYLIQGVMANQISSVPTSLPPGLYQQAGGTTSGIRTHATGTSGSFSPNATQSSFPQNRSYIQPQYTGQSMLQPQGTGMGVQKKPPPAPTLPARKTTNPSAIGNSAFGVPGSQAASQWDVTASEKASSDGFFDTLDTAKVGFIEGDVAVPFMLESKLPGEVLAQVWDLADLNNDGRLTRDGFAVAMHLIQKKLAGGEIPATLPPSLIPPTMRHGANGGITPSPFSPMGQQTHQVSTPEPQKDLFSFDESPPPSAAPSAGPFNVPMQSTGSQQQPSTFVSSSNFASPSVFASPSNSQDPFSASGKDFLSDDDEATASSHPLEDQSAEIGNTQNQLNSTNKSFTTTKNQRITLEQTLANQAAQLSALQTQLSSAKAAYETETKLLEALRERFTTQTADIEKTRTELITAESDLSAMRVEKSEIEGSFLRDKEEVRELNRKAFETGQQIETLKTEIEKSKKEAKQQKGLLAIAKKQLSSKEAERAKVEKELAEAQAATVAVTQEKDEVESELERIANAIPVVAIPAAAVASQPTYPERTTSEDSLSFAASQALPITPDIGSPASNKSNNPFERLAKSDPSTPRAQSPFLPFSNGSVPSPVILNGNAEQTANVSLDDPFGFSQAFNTSAATAPIDGTPAVENTNDPDFGFGTQTPKAALAALDVEDQSPVTPTTAHTEEFATPPSTADGGPASPVRKTTEEVIADKFPDLDDIAPSSAPASLETPTTSSVMPGHFGEQSEDGHDTSDLASLKELEPENDSDSSDEEDEVTLASLKAKATDADPALTTNGTPAASANYDVFGVAPSNGNAASTAEANDAFGMPLTAESSSPFGESVASPTEAGVNAFDEAMGKISSTSPAASSAAPQFSFDTAFDDNFDFGTASANNSFVSPATTNGSDGFESLFVTPPTNGAANSPAARPLSTFLPNIGASSPPQPFADLPTAAPAAPGPSFDEVFSGFDSSSAIKLSSPSPAAAAPPPAPIPVPSPVPVPATKAPSTPTQKPFPATNTSPSQSSIISRSSTPPLRQKSPPVRTGSPKPRPSNASSSKDGQEKEKIPPPRHSKLSIRLPFGKKRKQEAPPPPPSQFLTPPVEEPERTTSPAGDDDVEAVKQLTAMGFTRSQAVGALEKYAYDIPRALNSLLGQP